MKIRQNLQSWEEYPKSTKNHPKWTITKIYNVFLPKFKGSPPLIMAGSKRIIQINNFVIFWEKWKWKNKLALEVQISDNLLNQQVHLLKFSLQKKERLKPFIWQLCIKENVTDKCFKQGRAEQRQSVLKKQAHNIFSNL